MIFALAKFDNRLGNQIVWTSEPIEPDDLPALEFKMIPSGLHDRESDTIYFTSGSYFGVACYESKQFNSDGSREGIKTYSLAALDTISLPWNQEYYLKSHLQRFILDDDFKSLPIHKTPRNGVDNHPMQLKTEFVENYAATIFQLWKCGLARCRVLLASMPDASIKQMCQFVYIANQISSIPDDVIDLLPNYPRFNGGPPLLYNVTISDTQSLQSSESFWATTTDSLLLLPSRDAFDFYAEYSCLVDPSQRRLYPSWRDRRRFKKLVDCLRREDMNNPFGSTTNFDNIGTSSFLENVVDATATGLMWWASAGESSIIDHNDTSETAAILSPVDGMPGYSLLGQFQQHTRQLIRVFAKVAENSDDFPVIRIQLTDIAAMGLDPFASSDKEFLQRFALKWWDKSVVFGGRWCC